MSYIDHSLTYTRFRLKNIPHQLRLRTILRELTCTIKNTDSYVDIGCSNGFITKIVSDKFSTKTNLGLDHETKNLEKAKQKYPDIDFEFVDLNKTNIPDRQYDLVTCFETLEHVGNLENALKSITNFIKKEEGVALISVPIEIGFWGVIKYLLKVILYRYSLSELAGNPSRFLYFKKLLANGSISQFRDDRAGWGTHFGFDYRAIDSFLNNNNISFVAKNKFTTRFYQIKK